MKNLIFIFMILFSMKAYSYSLGVGFIGGGGAKSIKALESTSKSGDVVDIDYRYKLGLIFINKFQVSDSIFFKFNISAIRFDVDFSKSKSSPFLIKTDVALEFHPLKEDLKNFYFGGGLFINYFLSKGFSENNKGFSMLSAFLNIGYEIPLTKNISMNGEFSVEIFDIISIETKTKAYIGLSGTAYVLYHF